VDEFCFCDIHDRDDTTQMRTRRTLLVFLLSAEKFLVGDRNWAFGQRSKLSRCRPFGVAVRGSLAVPVYFSIRGARKEVVESILAKEFSGPHLPLQSVNKIGQSLYSARNSQTTAIEISPRAAQKL
jgi:hypothetical protein